MLKEIIKHLGLEPKEDDTDEQMRDIICEVLDSRNTQISTLESDKDALSKSNEELTASVEGYKSREEKLEKELSETKTELANVKGKLEQVTEMYKEQFTKDSDDIDESSKSDKDLENDVLQKILDTK